MAVVSWAAVEAPIALTFLTAARSAQATWLMNRVGYNDATTSGYV